MMLIAITFWIELGVSLPKQIQAAMHERIGVKSTVDRERIGVKSTVDRK